MTELYPSIDLTDYPPPDPSASEEELVALLSDPVWRLCNLYSISDKDGRSIPFVPRWPQRVVLYYIFVLGRKRIAIPKARQLGFSTLSELIAFDKAYWGKGQESVIIERTQQDAWEKMKIVKFAYDHLDPDFKDQDPTSDSKSDLAWKNDGSVVAGKSARGKNPQFLHISEWGPIAYEDPARSVEIKTGAIPAVSGKDSVIIAESTFKGGRGGDWYDIIQGGLKIADKYRTEKDWTVLFFPWYLEPVYTLQGDISQITPEVNEYLDDKERELRLKFSDQQRLWYYKEQLPEQTGKWIKREYPTTIDEMWSIREAGQIYASMLDKAGATGRIHDDLRPFGNLPLYAVFDIGAPDNTKCIIYQLVGDRRIYLLGKSGNSEDLATPAEWWAWLQSLNMKFGAIILPHDGKNPMVGSKGSWIEQMQKAGCQSAVTLRTPSSVWQNIVEAQSNFDRCEFHATGCADLLRALECYHCKQESDGVTIKDVPVHDWCIAEGQLISTVDGEIPIQNVSVGDRVTIGLESFKVLEFHDNGVRETVSIKLESGKELKCTPEHKVFTTIGLVMAKDIPNHVGVLTDDKLCGMKLQKKLNVSLKAAFTELTEALNIGCGQSEICTCRKSEESRLCFTRNCLKIALDDLLTEGKKRSSLLMEIGETLNVAIGQCECGTLEERRQLSMRLRHLRALDTIRSQEAITKLDMNTEVNICTEQSTGLNTDQFQMGTISTMSMKINPITEFKTLLRCLDQITSNCMLDRVVGIQKGSRKKVYDLTVEGSNAFVASGVLVSNCSHFATCFGYSHQAEKDGVHVDRSSIPVRQGPLKRPVVKLR